ncbi:MAG: Uma2 family endonuclease [Blastochloris sp.]|nr:Uma2 family endonuclease [Blastochloris sp.]
MPVVTAKHISTETKVITGDDLAALGAIGSYELVAGRIVPMSPTGELHGGYEANFCAILREFVKSHKLGKIRVGEVGIYTRRNPDTVRGADVLFISNERYAQVASRSYLDVAPDLIVEILSPNDVWSEVMQKLREYFDIGVRTVWLADPQARIVYVYRSMTDVREFKEHDDLIDEDVLPGFAAPVAAFFED